MATTESVPEPVLYAFRARLSDLGIPADDLDDAAIAREATLRGMVEVLGGGKLLPGSWDKRFLRRVPLFPGLLSSRQEEIVHLLWRKYRRHLPRIRARMGGGWPGWLPPIPDA